VSDQYQVMIRYGTRYATQKFPCVCGDEIDDWVITAVQKIWVATQNGTEVGGLGYLRRAIQNQAIDSYRRRGVRSDNQSLSTFIPGASGKTEILSDVVGEIDPISFCDAGMEFETFLERLSVNEVRILEHSANGLSLSEIQGVTGLARSTIIRCKKQIQNKWVNWRARSVLTT